MRRVTLFAVLMLSVCTFVAWAEAPSPVDKAQFLASLGTPQPVEAARRGGIHPKSTCTVNLTCDVGGYLLHCTSTSGNCSSTATSVTCDDMTQNCPICAESVDCCDGSNFSCVGWSTCSQAPRSVTCDGHFHGTCPPLSQCN